MSTSFKLIYFNFRGRAEISRLIFSLAKQNYEDKRIELKDWFAMKKDTVFGALPLLKVTDNNDNNNKTVLAQSVSISRYLATRFGMGGKSELERAQCDMIVDQIIDTQNVLMRIYQEFDKKPEKLDEALKKATSEIVPANLMGIEKLLAKNNNEKKNGTANGFLVGASLTYADLHMILFYDILREEKKSVLAKLDLLRAHDEKIRNIPAVAEHIKKNAHVKVSIKF